MEETVQALLDRAERAYAEDDLLLARACYRRILDSSPGHALATRALAEIERVLAEHFDAETVISLAVPLNQLMGTRASPREALVISRLAAGPMNVRRLCELSRVHPGDLHELLYRYLSDSVIVARKP